MADLPVHNETAYMLTAAMEHHIILDAHEHFGDEVRSIRVQEGLERHAFNARTQEVRYAFSPTDFGLVPTPPEFLEPPLPRRPPRRRVADDEEGHLAEPFEDEAMEVEDAPPPVRALASLEAGDDDEDEEDVEAVFTEDVDRFRLDDVTEVDDEDEDEALFDDEENEEEAYNDDEE